MMLINIIKNDTGTKFTFPIFQKQRTVLLFKHTVFYFHCNYIMSYDMCSQFV